MEGESFAPDPHVCRISKRSELEKWGLRGKKQLLLHTGSDMRWCWIEMMGEVRRKSEAPERLIWGAGSNGKPILTAQVRGGIAG